VSENLDLVRSIYTDWERGDFSRTDWAHSEMEFIVNGGPLTGNWRGRTATEVARDMRSPFEDFRLEADEYRELDDERVLVLYHRSGRGKLSELELGQMQTGGAHLFRIRNGKVTRFVGYWDRHDALADLGLEE
jgi:ketosteroid isomerase-like protein